MLCRYPNQSRETSFKSELHAVDRTTSITEQPLMTNCCTPHCVALKRIMLLFTARNLYLSSLILRIPRLTTDEVIMVGTNFSVLQLYEILSINYSYPFFSGFPYNFVLKQ